MNYVLNCKRGSAWVVLVLVKVFRWERKELNECVWEKWKNMYRFVDSKFFEVEE
ncbi:hypothetical protein E2C01_102515 [Portunus trituberculatus]|uniref:Uncharacterized protein n=1 Tax=Portunus trituberculatus TaxID=210409 RepID=A0A5B7KCT9_PORTR|nr:hypothetical protein [Portunus trituberculatus]